MAIAVGQSAKGTSGSSASLATSAVTTAATGSTFVVFTTWDSGSTFSSISDSKSNSYTQIGTEVAFGTLRTRLYYKENGVGGASHTATVAISAATFISVFFVEVTGGATSGILDQSGARNDAASPFTLAAGLTTTQANELLLAVCAGNSGSNPATYAESGLGSSTLVIEETNGVSFETGTIYKANKTATGTFNPSFTQSGGTSAAVYLATFKELIGSGAIISNFSAQPMLRGPM